MNVQPVKPHFHDFERLQSKKSVVTTGSTVSRTYSKCPIFHLPPQRKRRTKVQYGYHCNIGNGRKQAGTVKPWLTFQRKRCVLLFLAYIGKVVLLKMSVHNG